MTLISCVGIVSSENRSVNKKVKPIYDDRSITERLDEGYTELMDLKEMMKDYRDLMKKRSENSRSVKNKWHVRLDEQSSTFSYNTTKQTQRMLANADEQHASLIDKQIQSIQDVIKELQSQIRKLYIQKSFAAPHQHHQTEAFKKEFAVASKPLKELHEQLESLRQQKTRAEQHRHRARCKIEKLTARALIDKSQLERWSEESAEAERHLKRIRQEISELMDQIEEEEIKFKDFLAKLLERCKPFEQERVDLIRTTLLSFIAAIHSSSNSIELESIFSSVRTKIELTQDSCADLRFWSQSFGVNS